MPKKTTFSENTKDNFFLRIPNAIFSENTKGNFFLRMPKTIFFQRILKDKYFLRILKNKRNIVLAQRVLHWQNCWLKKTGNCVAFYFGRNIVDPTGGITNIQIEEMQPSNFLTHLFSSKHFQPLWVSTKKSKKSIKAQFTANVDQILGSFQYKIASILISIRALWSLLAL